ncbi:MAG: hypothetical protein K0S00_1857 [Xanthobacteraceae bacterium]|jgi:hypothetical protein|nr:hypothetical protein [Xanthobacteraceae bacterium]
MTVQYVRVKAESELFSPPVQAFGNLGILGTASAGPLNEATAITSPAEAKTAFGTGDLVNAIALAFSQTPGPSTIYAVRIADGEANADWEAGFDAITLADVQIVCLANVPMTADAIAATAAVAGPVAQLVDHVKTVSQDGDGRERIGVAMLESGKSDPTLAANLTSERMVYIAHKSAADAAAAVAGVIAGYEPHISLLLKPVSIVSAPFSPTEILKLNGAEAFGQGPAGKGVNWLTDPALIPGQGIFLGESYTADPVPLRPKGYIDIVRTLDFVTNMLKRRLLGSIGNVRISRSGLRSLVGQMEAVLEPLIGREMIESYKVTVPILSLLDRDPSSLTQTQIDAINEAQAARRIEVLIEVDYAGALHRLDITLKFT